MNEIDLVVFGGQVPPDRKADLREEIGATNPNVIFVQGLAGIPGLIVKQVRGAFAASHQYATPAPTYTPDSRSIRLTLPSPADVTVTVWWQTAFVPPDPTSDSLQLLNDQLAGGDQAIPVPDHVPPKAAFATDGDRRSDLRLQHRHGTMAVEPSRNWLLPERRSPRVRDR